VHSPLALDLGLAVLAMVLVAGPLWDCWEVLNPLRAPAGPDASNYLGSALAFETGRWNLAFEDRYPGFPWMVSLFARGPLRVPRVGTELSMALTVLAALPLYGLGRIMAGRAAGFFGAVLGLRQILAIDVGQSFTGYPLVATLDLSLLWLCLVFTRTGALWSAVGAGLLGAMAVATDPKQIPLVLASLAICALWAAARGTGSRLGRGTAILALLVPLPAINFLVGRVPQEMLSLEGILYRTPINTVGEGIANHVQDGFTLGASDAWRQLLPSFFRVFTEIAPKEGAVLDPTFLNGIPQLWPDTSYVWGAAILALPLALGWAWRKQPSRWVGIALVVVFWGSMGSTLRIHFANRYLQPHALAAPGAAAAVAQVVLGGPAVVAAGMTALLWPSSPFSQLDPSYVDEHAPGTDKWVSAGGGKQMLSLDWAVRRLPGDTTLFDFTMVDPPIILAAGFPYVRCARDTWGCQVELPETEGNIGVILRADEELSGWLPDGIHEPFPPPPPERLGECWHLKRKLGPRTGLYLWRCRRRPLPPPELHEGPPERPLHRR
jgi:hypothetical protein